jgi:serine/threonine-protein kinase RsbW/stage II sporulation protein AB (anti-sigma F factor)
MPEEFQSRQDFSLSAQRDGERLLIACAGELDLTTAPELEELLITSAPYGELEIDLAQLEFIDSSGLRLLLSERERMGRSGGLLRVVGVHGPVARVFAISGLDAELHPRQGGAPSPVAGPHAAAAPVTAGYHEVFVAEPLSVSAIRHTLQDWARAAGIREEIISAVGLAVSEASTNAVVHAYADHVEPGPITVAAGLDDDALWVNVCDEGRGMRPRPDSPGLGLGLPLIAQMTSVFEVHEGDAGGTEVRMRFAI